MSFSVFLWYLSAVLVLLAFALLIVSIVRNAFPSISELCLLAIALLLLASQSPKP